MTGRGRCQRRRKSMAGGRGAAVPAKIEANHETPKLNPEITKKPSGSPEITKISPKPSVEIDLYAQACKALSLRSPFDSEDSQATPASVSSVNHLPSGVSHLLNRHSDNRKRQKKLQSGTEKKSSAAGKARGRNIWDETEEYFREVALEDVERLEKLSSSGFLGDEKCFSIPYLIGDDNLHVYYDKFNRMLASTSEKDMVNLENGAELKSNGELGFDERMAREKDGLHSTHVDGDEVVTTEFQIKEESNGGKKLNSVDDSTTFSGVEWLLGSKSKIYMASERPSKKRKLLGRDAGLEKLLVARPAEGLESVCHYCSYGDMCNPLNLLIKCSSCGMVVHQRCYGVQDDVESSWVCSWCKWKNVVDLSIETPCILCPKQGGALKPVQKNRVGRDNEGSKVDFAHLFCCQWMPEVYLENTRTMEPIMNLDDLKDTRRKMVCYLCKVKRGACVRCSNGSCRTSFHPICAREARHRMEIWAKIGSDEVELRAFCNKHSEVQSNNGIQEAAEVSFAADLEGSKLNDIGLDDEGLLDNSESYPENGDALRSAAKFLAHRYGNEDVNGCSDLKLSMILKKLIDLRKVTAKDISAEIGVSLDSLDTILTDNQMVSETRCKLLGWLKNHARDANLQKTTNMKIRLLVEHKDEADLAHGVDVPVQESNVSDSVPVKSVPPRRRTKSSIRTVKDDMPCSSKDNGYDEITEGDVDSCVRVGEDSINPSGDFPDTVKKILINSEQHQDVSANNSIKIEDELGALVHFLSEDGLSEEIIQSQTMTRCSPVLVNGESSHASYIHPFIYSKLMQTRNDVVDRSATCQSVVLNDREACQLEASSSSGPCCKNDTLQGIPGDRTSRCSGVNLDQLVEARNMGILKLSPADEVEGELLYYQRRLLSNAVVRKHTSGLYPLLVACLIFIYLWILLLIICVNFIFIVISPDNLISKVVPSLPHEMDASGKRKWDAVLVSHYHHELKEAKKQGRKERRHKEAQAVLAAATAAAAASTRSTIRKDTPEESSQQEDVRQGVHSQPKPRVKESISRFGVARSSFGTNFDSVQLASDFLKDHPSTCEVCRRSETVLNPILVCSSCKVAVHMDCYRSVKSTTGPWHCELCEDLVSSRTSVALSTNSWEKPCFVAECGLCGGTAGAFRKSVDSQWIHALCAEWVLESTYRRGQVNPIGGMDSVSKGSDTCTVCRRKYGVCLKCSYGHCQTTFHPTCARSAGFYMTVRTNGGKLQHKAYCEKHSTDQRAKADTLKHGIEEFKSLKQVRVELERLRLLCERIIKREKLKRELVVCSHDFLASSRDSVISALARHPFYQPEVSSESATTSLKGYTDASREMVHRSEDVTVDSTVAGKKRRVKNQISMDNDRKTDDSSTSQNLYTLKPVERVSFSGKQVPKRLSVASRKDSEDVEKKFKHRKQPETFEKELLMTSDQASMKNQRLPKGFVYVPIRSLPTKDKDNAPP